MIAFDTTESFEEWLARHHGEHGGIWIHFFKAASGTPSITYAQALDVALCYGWIDGPIRKCDEASWIHKFTPRGRRSVWSKRTNLHVDRLTKQGRMQPAGKPKLTRPRPMVGGMPPMRRRLRSWSPPNFMTALQKSKKAAAFYASLSKSNRYAIYYRIHTAKKPETKKRKIAEFIAMLERGETISLSFEARDRRTHQLCDPGFASIHLR